MFNVLAAIAVYVALIIVSVEYPTIVGQHISIEQRDTCDSPFDGLGSNEGGTFRLHVFGSANKYKNHSHLNGC